MRPSALLPTGSKKSLLSCFLFLAALAASQPARADIEPRHLYEFNRELTRALQGRPGPASLLPSSITTSAWFLEVKESLRGARGVVRLVSEEDSICLLSAGGRSCWLPEIGRAHV